MMKPLVIICLLGLSMLIGSGCGVDTSTIGPNKLVQSQQNTQKKATLKPAAMPDGVVRIDLTTGDKIATDTLHTFTNDTTGVTTQVATTSDTTAFDNLCSGKVDAITINRAPTNAEINVCKEYGLKLSEGIVVASDAVVVATKNNSDVGGDCVTVAQARDIFRNGSPYTNWKQLGFYDLPLRTVGREEKSANFRLFAQIVLGIANPSIQDVSSDYVIKLTDKSQRETVTGAAVVRQANKQFNRYRKKYLQQTQGPKSAYINAQIQKAVNVVLAKIDRVNAYNKKHQVVVDGPALIKKNASLVNNAKATAKRKATAVYNARLNRQLKRYASNVISALGYATPGVALKDNLGQRGFIGPFRYSYYGLFEDELRPMEVDFGVPETLSGQPIQLQDLTPSDQQAVKAEAAALARNQKVAPAPLTAESVLPSLPNLPARTKDKQIIFTGPNCVFPSALTISNGSYPLTRRTFIYSTNRSLKRPETKTFLTYLLEHAQSLALARQMIEITDYQLQQGLAIVKGTKQPKAPKTNGGEAKLPAVTTTTPTSTTTSTTPATPTPTTPTTPTTQNLPSGTPSGIPGVSPR